ncbi:MAG TPA: GNAT family N-acetyltransferase [Actinomycetota bacterium]|nr:GNAT family N-acetyltransferase [Actinomycetota bacterium]
MDADRFLPFWRALDGLLERVEPTPWGAVVTDRRFPHVWDANYARVEAAEPPPLAEVEAALRPALARAGADRFHVVLHRPEEQADLLVELSARGDHLSWDVVMEHRPRPDGRAGEPGPPASHPRLAPGAEIAEVELDRRFWGTFRASLAAFGVTDAGAVEELVALEREVFGPVKRWFAVRADGEIASLAALVALAGAGYVDHVVTFPAHRRRGYAGALVARLAAEARAAGCDPVFLLAEDGAPAVRLYERLGFRTVGRIGSTLAPLRG